MQIPAEAEGLFKALAVQFGAVSFAAMACTEFLPLIPARWIGPPYRKRLIAVLYALPLSFVAVFLGLVELPVARHVEELAPGYGELARWALVPVLAVLSVVAAHLYHGGWSGIKRMIAKDYDNRSGPNLPK